MDLSLEKKYLRTDKGDVCYFIAGPAHPAQTVMLLHGLSSNHTTWLALMKMLAESGIRTIAPDLRGHGFSDKTREKSHYALPVFAEDIRRIAQAERLQKFDMVGYSFGGYVALSYAAAYPASLRSLTLVSTNFMNPLHYRFFSPLAPALVAFAESLAWLSSPHGRENYHYFEHEKSTGYFDSTFKGFLTMPLSVNFWMLAETLRLDLSSSLPCITCPTLIIRSADDPYLTEREVRDLTHNIKRSIAVTFLGSSHFIASRNQDLLAEQLLPFLADPLKNIS